MNSKERAYFRGLAHKIDPIFSVGKASITPEITAAIDEALEARELIKINVLKNCMDDPREISEILSERTRSEIVQVMGKKITLYKPSKNNPKITFNKK